METKSISYTPEIWGGLECSYNRVGDQFMDQLHFSGYYQRGEDDIHRIASLCVRKLRFPIIWERHQPFPDSVIDFSFTERQLNVLQSHDIIPIVGLMHHGNGPAFTHLLSSSFAEHFADYAGTVARKFPWLEYYTPINEPLTTARFSGLYGIWYPHAKNDHDFAMIFLHQMKAIVLAMNAIREVNPRAKLLQTEDLCKTYSTPLLRYQADFENERRWLTFDILCGRMKRGHALWDYFQWLKVPEKLFDFFLNHPFPPDLIGADHYLTSERFLDENLDLYPPQKHGSNHRHTYVDVEAIRVDHCEPWGLKVLLRECWERYKIPMAVTEVHINGHNNDQIRWFREVWDTARDLNSQGIDIRAVAAWSLLGSFGWSNLLTAPDGHYEAGAFDLSSGKPESTELAAFIRGVSKDPDHWHPALQCPGWWRDEKTRCFYGVRPEYKAADSMHSVM